jgi:hypothetical protein
MRMPQQSPKVHREFVGNGYSAFTLKAMNSGISPSGGGGGKGGGGGGNCRTVCAALGYCCGGGGYHCIGGRNETCTSVGYCNLYGQTGVWCTCCS